MTRLTCGMGMDVLARTRSIASDSERAESKDSQSFTMVSSDIWTIALLLNERGADLTRRIISSSPHLSDVNFSNKTKKGGGRSAFGMDTGLAYAHGDIMASSVGPEPQDHIESFGDYMNYHKLEPIPGSAFR
jgi:hypothetical protein